ncbi:MAG: TetR/AcrR family transcriptional regulator [Ktedonobacterales bacterium]|nr:TetR/AcrR family transcriptional regulator [Ktedonobacterales bacterium]
MVKKDVTSDKPERTAEKLLRVAARLFRQHGYAATSTQQLATELGLQKGSLYHHIEKKEELLYLICMDALMHIQLAVEKAIEPISDPGDRLRTLIRAHTCTALDDQDKFATALLDNRELSDENKSTIMELHDYYEGVVQEVIRACQEAGIVRRDTAPRQLTLFLLSMMNFTAFWYRPDGKLTPDDLADQFIQQFLQGAGVPLCDDAPHP